MRTLIIPCNHIKSIQVTYVPYDEEAKKVLFDTQALGLFSRNTIDCFSLWPAC